jgi:hypothetical protein
MTTLAEAGPRRPRSEPRPSKDGTRRHCCPTTRRGAKAADSAAEDADPVSPHADPALSMPISLPVF